MVVVWGTVRVHPQLWHIVFSRAGGSYPAKQVLDVMGIANSHFLNATFRVCEAENACVLS